MATCNTPRKPDGLEIYMVPDGVIIKWNRLHGNGIYEILDYNIQILKTTDVLWGESASYCTKQNFLKINLAYGKYRIRVRGRSRLGIGQSSDTLVVTINNSAATKCCHCTKTFKANSLSSHQKKCMDRDIQCPHCFDIVKLKLFDEHECQQERQPTEENFPWFKSVQKHKKILQRERPSHSEPRQKIKEASAAAGNNYDEYSQYPAKKATYSYGSYAGDSSYSQKIQGGANAGAYTGSSMRNLGSPSAPAGIKAYERHNGAEYGLNQAKSSYEQQPAASSNSAAKYSQYPARKARYSYGSYAGDSSYSQKIITGGANAGAYTGSSMRNLGSPSAPAGIKAYERHNGAEYGLNQAKSSYEQQPAASSNSAASNDRYKTLYRRAANAVQYLNKQMAEKMKSLTSLEEEVDKRRDRLAKVTEYAEYLRTAECLFPDTIKLIERLKKELQDVKDEEENLRRQLISIDEDIFKITEEQNLRTEELLNGPMAQLENLLKKMGM